MIRHAQELMKEQEPIFIIHPFKGHGREGERELNLARIGKIARTLALAGLLPISPVHAYGFLNDEDEKERARGIAGAVYLLRKAKRAWAFGDVWKSEGSKREILEAVESGYRLNGNVMVVENLEPGKRPEVRQWMGEAAYDGVAMEALKDYSRDGHVIVDGAFMPGFIEAAIAYNAGPLLGNWEITLEIRGIKAEYWRIERRPGR